MDSVQAFLRMGVPYEPTTGMKAMMARRGDITEPELNCELCERKGVLLPSSPSSSLLTLDIPLLCLQSLPFPITTYLTTINIQLRHPIGNGAAEARIPSVEPISRLIHLSLACDQCRKTKSKCERSKSDDDPCKSCLAAGTGTTSFSLTPTIQLTRSPACTFLGIPTSSPPPLPSDRSSNRSELQAWPS